MNYKTLSTIIHKGNIGHGALDAAIDLTRQQDAHLSIITTAFNMADINAYYAAGNAAMMYAGLEAATQEATELSQSIRTRLKGEDIRWDEIHAAIPPSGLQHLILSNSRFTDLTILPRPYGEGRDQEDVSILESALLDARAPVLSIPEGMNSLSAPRKILLAWDQSDEALRTTRFAMPFLVAADLTEIVVVDPPRHGPERSDPGGLLAMMIARHGGKAEVNVLGKSEGRVSDILLRRALEHGSDMIVMGGYGHSRMKQSILGGTTRRLLEESTFPLFLAH